MYIFDASRLPLSITSFKENGFLAALLVIPLSFALISFSRTPSQAGQAQRDSLLFADMTQKSGLSLGTPHSYAAAAADYDKNGFSDILICHHGKLSLWKNNGDGTFSDVSPIVPKIPADKHGVSFIDLNKDGFVDIAVAVGGDRGRGEGKNLFFVNRSGKYFLQESNPEPLIEYQQGRGRSVIPVDINQDQNIDLLIMNYVAKKNDPPHRLAINNNHDTSTSTWSNSPLNEQFSMAFGFGCTIVGLDHSNNLFFIITGPGQDAGKIFQLKHDILTNITDKLGIDSKGCMSVTPIDYDNDGDLDLFYGRGLPPPSSSVGLSDGKLEFIIINKDKTTKGFNCFTKNGQIKIDIRFEQKAGSLNLHLGKNKKIIGQSTPLQIDLADTSLQGEPIIDQASDIGGFLWRDPSTKVLHFRFLGTDTLQETEGVIQPIGFQFTDLENINIQTSNFPHYQNSLYKNENGHFIDVANKAEILGSGQVFTSLAADFNNDGFQDIYTVNIGQSFDELNPPNHLFLNKGDSTFEEVASQCGATGPKTGIGSGAIAFDYDGDGKLDIFLHNGNTIFPQEDGPLVLLKNISKTKNKSIQLTLQGFRETQGWGTKISSSQGDNNTLLQQNYALNGYLSASDLPIHIGLGARSEIKKLHVEWPSGKQQDILHTTKAKLTIIEPH